MNAPGTQPDAAAKQPATVTVSTSPLGIKVSGFCNAGETVRVIITNASGTEVVNQSQTMADAGMFQHTFQLPSGDYEVKIDALAPSVTNITVP